MASNKEITKTLETLLASVRSIQDELVTLKREATHSSTNPQSGSSMQYNSTDIAGLVPPPDKKSRLEDDEANSDEKIGNIDTQQGPLVPISEVAAEFLEASFNTKLDSKSRKAKANGTPDSRWIQCAKLDSVVVPTLHQRHGRRTEQVVTSRISGWMQQPLSYSSWRRQRNWSYRLSLLMGSRPLFRLMGNANYQHSMDRRHALMTHLTQN